MMSLYKSGSSPVWRRPNCIYNHFFCNRTSRCSFSSTAKLKSYDDTIENLRIGSHTRVLYQGFTGRQATANARESLAWGTKIVGGVKPGVEGEHLGLPIVPTVRRAKEELQPDVSAIYVPGNQTAQAVEEAIEAEIPLVVAVAEHVPIHDILRIHSILRTQSKTRLVGANCPGIISAIGKCRVGFQPLPCFSPGRIGIVAKSGTLSYETVASTTRAGFGQSLCISMGGDVLAGTTFVDALKVFEDDPDTEGIALVGEVGGRAEEDAAEWIKDYRKRVTNPKPIMALIGGIQAAPGRVMGHAGAWAAPGESSAKDKIRALEDAGVTMVYHPEKFGDGMKRLLQGSGASIRQPSIPGTGQRRGLYTMRRRPEAESQTARAPSAQVRSLYITSDQALKILEEEGVKVSSSGGDEQRLLAISIDRSARSPCIVASPSAGSDSVALSKTFPFDYGAPIPASHVTAVLSHLGLLESKHEDLTSLLDSLQKIFMEKEAFVLETKLDNSLLVTSARFGFDDAAFRSSGRQSNVHGLRDKSIEVREEVEAEKDGIVYVKYGGEGSIGTLVNGAGLAMNTVDSITLHGGHCANFLDTGGKATTETVKSSFRIIASDERVKAIFVNIFGGLTLCDMIAEGIILAFRDLNLKVPIVVRLRGTNEEKGQKIIAESGLPLHAFDEFEPAAKKIIELARQAKQKI